MLPGLGPPQLAFIRRAHRAAGLAGGITIGSAAAARRTDSAYTRFLKAVDPSDVSVQSTDAPLDLEAIGRLPEVESADNVPYVFLDPAPGESYPDLSPLFLPDSRSVERDRTKLLEGRRPDPDRADEASGLLVANTTAILPGLAAARIRPATVLRSQQATRT